MILLQTRSSYGADPTYALITGSGMGGLVCGSILIIRDDELLMHDLGCNSR